MDAMHNNLVNWVLNNILGPYGVVVLLLILCVVLGWLFYRFVENRFAALTASFAACEKDRQKLVERVIALEVETRTVLWLRDGKPT